MFCAHLFNGNLARLSKKVVFHVFTPALRFLHLNHEQRQPRATEMGKGPEGKMYESS